MFAQAVNPVVDHMTVYIVAGLWIGVRFAEKFFDMHQAKKSESPEGKCSFCPLHPKLEEEVRQVAAGFDKIEAKLDETQRTVQCIDKKLAVHIATCEELSKQEQSKTRRT